MLVPSARCAPDVQKRAQKSSVYKDVHVSSHFARSEQQASPSLLDAHFHTLTVKNSIHLTNFITSTATCLQVITNRQDVQDHCHLEPARCERGSSRLGGIRDCQWREPHQLQPVCGPLQEPRARFHWLGKTILSFENIRNGKRIGARSSVANQMPPAPCKILHVLFKLTHR